MNSITNAMRTVCRSSTRSVSYRYFSSTADTVKKAAGAFKEDGVIGKEFTPEGKVGGAAQAVGGPFDKNGAIGKNFTTDGAIGGTGQKVAEKVQEKAEDSKQSGNKGTSTSGKQ